MDPVGNDCGGLSAQAAVIQTDLNHGSTMMGEEGGGHAGAYISGGAGSRADQRSSLDGGKSSQICFDFTKGLCTRGDKCKHSHDLATIVHFNSKEKGICFDYLRNQCHRGLLCRFSHDLRQVQQAGKHSWGPHMRAHTQLLP